MSSVVSSLLARIHPPAAPARGIASSDAVAESLVPNAQRATVAAGCFWGVEHIYRKHFSEKGLLSTRVGYIGGDLTSPSYDDVCSGKTNHAEATQLIFDPDKVTYRELIEFFYRMHDPTTLNSQGYDMGSQYRSAIFFHDAEQERVAKEVTDLANKKWWKNKIVTELTPAGKWWDAEEYHQMYLERVPNGYQCKSHHPRPFPPLE